MIEPLDNDYSGREDFLKTIISFLVTNMWSIKKFSDAFANF